MLNCEGYRDGTYDLKMRPDVLGRPSATALQEGPFDTDFEADIIPGYTANNYPSPRPLSRIKPIYRLQSRRKAHFRRAADLSRAIE